MNEKFLSRGKREDNGEWITGYYVKLLEHHIIFDLDGDVHYIIPETVGRCTGLTDKNGNRIFEEDIIKAIWQHLGNTDTVIGIVKYDNAAFILETNDHYLFFEDNIFSFECEVIGNIHDNPELIGGDKNA